MAENKIFNSLLTGLNEAINYEKDKLTQKVRTVVISIEPVPHYKAKQIKSIRDKLNLTQVMFAKVLGVSIKTVEAWESGRNIPNGPAQRMLGLLFNEEDFLEKHNILQVR